MGAATLTYQELTGARRVTHSPSGFWTLWSGYDVTWAGLIAQAQLALWIQDEMRRQFPPMEYTIWLPPQPSRPWMPQPDDDRPPCDGNTWVD